MIIGNLDMSWCVKELPTFSCNIFASNWHLNFPPRYKMLKRLKWMNKGVVEGGDTASNINNHEWTVCVCVEEWKKRERDREITSANVSIIIMSLFPKWEYSISNTMLINVCPFSIWISNSHDCFMTQWMAECSLISSNRTYIDENAAFNMDFIAPRCVVHFLCIIGWI